jgi:hypothetical protein
VAFLELGDGCVSFFRINHGGSAADELRDRDQLSVTGDWSALPREAVVESELLLRVASASTPTVEYLVG